MSVKVQPIVDDVLSLILEENLRIDVRCNHCYAKYRYDGDPFDSNMDRFHCSGPFCIRWFWRRELDTMRPDDLSRQMYVWLPVQQTERLELFDDQQAKACYHRIRPSTDEECLQDALRELNDARRRVRGALD